MGNIFDPRKGGDLVLPARVKGHPSEYKDNRLNISVGGGVYSVTSTMKAESWAETEINMEAVARCGVVMLRKEDADLTRFILTHGEDGDPYSSVIELSNIIDYTVTSEKDRGVRVNMVIMGLPILYKDAVKSALGGK